MDRYTKHIRRRRTLDAIKDLSRAEIAYKINALEDDIQRLKIRLSCTEEDKQFYRASGAAL